jgi:hypothetical protein
MCISKDLTAALFSCLLFAAAPAADASLDDLAFMAGAWDGTQGGVETEEIWTVPRGGLMLGVHRDVMASGRAAFEYLRIEVDADGIVYKASPQGRAATPFRLVEISPGRAVFSNPDHDFPRTLSYWLEDGDLRVRAEGETRGEPMTLQWRWERRSLLADPPADAPPAPRGLRSRP